MKNNYNWVFPKPHVLDLRSLALLRILIGLMQLYDVYSRTKNGKYDLAWYTSDSPEHSYDTTPMPSIHEYNLPSMFPFVFARRSFQAECFHFALYAVLSTFLVIGLKARWVLPVMWIMCCAHQSKADTLGDGSDLLVGQLMLIMCLLPISQMWSVDAYLARNKNNTSDDYRNNQVGSIACLCLTLQIVMMYIGAFFGRTFDYYTLAQLIKGGVSDWLWPQFSLVHYASNGSGVYKSFVSDIIRKTPLLNQFMSFSGFWLELICPLFCFVFNQRYSHWGAIPLVMLHFGIGQILNIPHWVIVGCIIHVIWIPTHVWDSILGSKKEPPDHENKKEQDGDMTKNAPPSSLHVTKECCNGIALCVLYLLITTFGQSRGWVPEALKTDLLARSHGFYNSNWEMWSNAPRESPFTMILGWRPPPIEGGRDPHDLDNWEAMNLYRFMKTGEEVAFVNFTDDVLDSFTYEYPSTRWEKGIGDEWSTNVRRLADPMGKALCNMVNEDLQSRGGGRPIFFVQIVIHFREIMPIGSSKRWKKDDPEDTLRHDIDCLPMPFERVKKRDFYKTEEDDDDNDDNDDDDDDDDNDDDDDDDDNDDDDEDELDDEKE